MNIYGISLKSEPIVDNLFFFFNESQNRIQVPGVTERSILTINILCLSKFCHSVCGVA